MRVMNGDKVWHNGKGELHKLDGPAAVIFGSGAEYWYRNDLAHRLDGPASFYPNENQFWWWLGKMCNEQQHSILSNIRFFTRRIKI